MYELLGINFFFTYFYWVYLWITRYFFTECIYFTEKNFILNGIMPTENKVVYLLLEFLKKVYKICNFVIY